MNKKNIYKSLLLTAITGIMVGCNGVSNNPNAVETLTSLNKSNASAVASKVHTEFPMIPESSMSVEINPDLNLYQVYALGQVMYVTPDLKYFIGGHYFKFGDDKRTDLTQDYIDNKNIVDVKSLPINLAVKHTIGSGKNVFYVFSDPECPYCHMLQSEVVNKLNDTTVYTFLYPLPMHKNAYNDSIKIMCSSNPDKVYTKWMTISPDLQEKQHDSYFSSLKTCDSGKQAVDKMMQLGQTLNISGTPTIINTSGKKIGLQELAQMSQQQAGVESVSVGN